LLHCHEHSTGSTELFARASASTMSRGGDEDLESIEVELSRLHRQQRVTAGQRKALNDSSSNELRKQETQLVKLRNDNAVLKEDLRLAETEHNSQQSTGGLIRELKARYAGYEAEIEAEHERKRYYETMLKSILDEKEIEDKELGMLQTQVRSPESYAQEIATLENRVEHALNGYDNQLTRNAKLRESIDHLKKERNVFSGLKAKLVAQLAEQKKMMGEIIDASNQAYETRDDAQARMLALRERSDKELQESTMELKELNRVLEQERKLKDFMGVKGRDRAKDLEQAAKARKEKGEAKEKPEEIISQYEDVFNQIKQHCGIQETSKLVDQFIETEDRNFSKFNLVNELNTNIEMLKEQIHSVEHSIQNYNSQSEAMDSERKETLIQLEKKLQETETEGGSLEGKSEDKEAELVKLVKGIEELFEKIGCDTGPIQEMLGEKDVNERNIMQFLGIIEQRANDLLLAQAKLDYMAQKKWDEEAKSKIIEHTLANPGHEGAYNPEADLGEKPQVHSVLGTGPKSMSNTTEITKVALPNSNDDYDDDDDEDDDESLRPLTHAELKTKIVRTMKTKKLETPSKF